jgi:hypothetical protein
MPVIETAKGEEREASMKHYMCRGGDGCSKPGCKIATNGVPYEGDNKLYICPYNHWRSAEWVAVRKPKAKKGAKG